jgi:hypothetical protein
MNAHLRASNYPERDGKRFAAELRRRNDEAVARRDRPTLLQLGPQYDTQARDNSSTKRSFSLDRHGVALAHH